MSNPLTASVAEQKAALWLIETRRVTIPKRLKAAMTHAEEAFMEGVELYFGLRRSFLRAFMERGENAKALIELRKRCHQAREEIERLRSEHKATCKQAREARATEALRIARKQAAAEELRIAKQQAADLRTKARRLGESADRVGQSLQFIASTAIGPGLTAFTGNTPSWR